ncbi:hypothetical protein C0J52_05065 [Blattella germanica]|nr:hypothetical protein C0J52_05065 [Blattella germanica]
MAGRLEDEEYWHSSEAKAFSFEDDEFGSQLCGVSKSGTARLSQRVREGMGGGESPYFSADSLSGSLSRATISDAPQTNSRPLQTLISERSLHCILEAGNVRDKAPRGTLTPEEEVRILRRQIEGRWVPPPVNETITKILLGQPYSLELYRSLQSKTELLDAAIAMGLVYQLLRTRPDAVAQYSQYLSTRLQLHELTDLLEMLGDSREAAMKQFQIGVCGTVNPHRRLQKLQTCLKNHFSSPDSRDQQLVDGYIKLLEWQIAMAGTDAEIAKVLVGQSVLSSLAYACRHHWGEPRGAASSPLTLSQQQGVSDRHFQWTVLTVRASMKAWDDVEGLFITKSWLGGKKLKAAVPMEQVVLQLHMHGAPTEVLVKYLELIDNADKRVALAQKLQCHKAVINVFISKRDRQSLISYKANLHPQRSSDIRLFNFFQSVNMNHIYFINNTFIFVFFSFILQMEANNNMMTQQIKAEIDDLEIATSPCYDSDEDKKSLQQQIKKEAKTCFSDHRECGSEVSLEEDLSIDEKGLFKTECLNCSYDFNESFREDDDHNSNVNEENAHGGLDDDSISCESYFEENFKRGATTKEIVGPLQCPICNKPFPRKKNFNQHMKTHINNRSFHCETCGKSFSRKDVLHKHLISHSTVRSFSCKICTRSFNHKHHLSRHMTTHTTNRPFEDRPFQCEMCSKCFTRKSHKMMMLQIKEEVCDISEVEQRNCGNAEDKKCLQIIKEEDNRISEVDTNYNDNFEIYPIEKIENKVFLEEVPNESLSTDENNLYKKEHDFNVSSDEDDRCKSNVNLINADEIFHGNAAEDSSCERLDKSYLKENSKGDKMDSPFQCAECNRQFSSKQKLKRHMDIHTSNRPFHCETCKKSFIRKDHFDTHLITHANIRPFECEICRKSFGQRRLLTRHMTTHTEDRPFACEICSKCFKLKASLDRHSVSHRSDHPFQCKICSKSYGFKSFLKTHMINHTMDRPFRCDICSKCFAHKSFLQSHMNMTMQHIKVEINDIPEVESDDYDHAEVLHQPIKEEAYQISEVEAQFSDPPEDHSVFVKIPPIEKCESQDSPEESCFSVDDNCLFKTEYVSCSYEVKSDVDVDSGDEIIRQEDGQYSCATLDKLNLKEDFEEQNSTEETVNSLQCAICKIEFPQIKKLKEHMNIHANSESFQCEACKKVFSRKDYLDRHMITHTTIRPFGCETCGKSFNRKDNLEKHLITHTTARPFECEICRKSFNQKGHLFRHMFTHTKNSPYVCKICNKSFGQKSRLDIHVISHESNRTYECEICKKSFVRKDLRDRHLIIHTTNSNCQYQCEICSKTFKQKNHISKHMLIHTNNRSFRCEICGKSFLRKSHRDGHMITHTNIRPYPCEICKKAFTQKSSLKLHLLTHSTAVPFQCDVCSKAFRQKSTLDRHKTTHSNGHLFHCEICSKSFPRKDCLDSHSVIHSTDSPYRCEVCNKCFSRKSYVKTHMIIHGMDRPFHCEICNKSFTQRSNLNKHFTTHQQLPAASFLQG